MASSSTSTLKKSPISPARISLFSSLARTFLKAKSPVGEILSNLIAPYAQWPPQSGSHCLDIPMIPHCPQTRNMILVDRLGNRLRRCYCSRASKTRNGYRLRTQVLANITSFHQCTSALAVYPVFLMPSEL